MNKKQKCALKHAVKESLWFWVLLASVFIVMVAGMIPVAIGATCVYNYIVASYPWVFTPITITNGQALFLTVIGMGIVFVSTAYSDMRMRYKKYLKSKECEEQK